MTGRPTVYTVWWGNLILFALPDVIDAPSPTANNERPVPVHGRNPEPPLQPGQERLQELRALRHSIGQLPSPAAHVQRHGGRRGMQRPLREPA